MKVRSILTMLAAAAAVTAFALRVPSIAEPLGIDQSLWASAVRGMARHQLLYRDVWEQRPPGIYFTYLTGFRVFGWTPAAVAWMDILASAATTLLLFAIVRCLAGVATAAVASALYATLTMPGWLYRHDGFLERSVCETFIVVCVGLAAWCAVRWRQASRNGAQLWALGVGFFSGAAVVYKPNAGLYLPAILLWMWFYRPPSSTTRDGVRVFVAAALAAMVAPALTIVWLLVEFRHAVRAPTLAACASVTRAPMKRPMSMIPNSTATRKGKISANSIVVEPRSSPSKRFAGRVRTSAV